MNNFKPIRGAFVSLFRSLLSNRALASAQQPEGEVTGPTLASEDPGVLVVTWDRVSPQTVDYRVSWARSDEGCLTCSDESGNSFPTGEMLTLAGLDE